MSDTVLAIKQIEDIYRDLTLQMLGLDPEDKKNKSRVRIGWPTGGAPAWKITDDVIFLLINYDDDPYTRQVDVSYNPAADVASRSSAYTRVLRVNWVAYGPSSFDDMDQVRHGLFLPQFSSQLAANNLALILDMTMPVRTPELYNGQWWERTTFYARFNELVVRSIEVPYLESAEVKIVKG